MHAVLFRFKRAFQSTLRTTRPIIASHGLTAARFDLLYQVDGYDGRVLQSTLRRTLGVSAPVVTRMLQSLESLGLVVRKRAHDRRHLFVALTELGRRVIRRAIRAIIGRGVVQFVFDCAILSPRLGDSEERFRLLSALEDSLRTIADSFGDTGYVGYPWHPDD